MSICTDKAWVSYYNLIVVHLGVFSGTSSIKQRMGFSKKTEGMFLFYLLDQYSRDIIKNNLFILMSVIAFCCLLLQIVFLLYISVS